MTKTNKMPSMKKAKKLLKEANLQDLANPVKIMNDLQDTDLIKSMLKMGAGIDDGFMLIQEQVLTVQKNQIEFQKYFEATYKKVESLENKIKELEKVIRNEH